MSLAILASRALAGLEALPVRVETHVGSGLPAFHVVGLPDAGVRESRERVRAAILSSGFEFPSGRITVNLAPADLPKESGRFDLPIALGILLASGQISPAHNTEPIKLQCYVFAGELSLTGAIMPVTAPLAIALAIPKTDPPHVLVLPHHDAGLAAHVSGIRILGARTLRDVVEHFEGTAALSPPEAEPFSTPSVPHYCLSDVRGQGMARRAIEVAASGRHSLLMVGSPGTGKSMLAHRLPGLLPLLTHDQALEVAALSGLAGAPRLSYSLEPPFRSPHHSSSVPALVGGGVFPRPGEISRAHRGVLFLDELAEFKRAVIESLREPLETGQVTIARAARSTTFPAEFQLVAAMNPCPCGWSGHLQKTCSCTPDQVARYRAKITGPFLDRVDLHIGLKTAGSDWLELPAGETSAVVRGRVGRCLDIQYQRQGCANAGLSVSQIERYCRLNAQGKRLLQQSMVRWSWSARSVHRLLRVARTLADMSAHDDISVSDLAEAIQYRDAWPEQPHQGGARI